MPDPENPQTRKQGAVDFLQLVVTGQIDEAYEKHVDLQGKHHNPFFPAGFAALTKAMKENHVQFPNKQITIQHVLGDGDMVAVHSRILVRQGEPAMSVVHIFRFQGDKIVEMWDIGQPIPADSPNTDSGF